MHWQVHPKASAATGVKHATTMTRMSTGRSVRQAEEPWLG
eukprot:CAMPEP_0184378454 /NCGR_PEP_ID=MMETSP0007-20130409/3093_1 /TAXON_ID=97485 /ORGANISM="Prymnesium parvum, Strain Texoma1" /LENGTH=39 /DNA_ID= /DNA_START= /DNA_END= /DNA_ORIENTATION=